MALKNAGAWVITFVISLVIVFYIAGNIIPEAQEAGTDLGTSSQGSCVAVGCVWNTTNCINASSIQGDHTDTGTCAETEPVMPLASLFSSAGVVFILVAIALLLFALGKARLGKK